MGIHAARVKLFRGVALLVFVAPALVAAWFTLFSSLRVARAAEGDQDQKLRVYAGTYTGAKSKGVYLLELDLKTGELLPKGLAAASSSPSFLAFHPNRQFLYAVNEVDTGTVSSFAIDAQTGLLTFLNKQRTRGAHPTHLVVDRQGKNVLAANYSGGSVAVLPIGADGQLGAATGFIQHTGKSVDRSRQTAPHAHGMALDTTGQFAYVADLGLDKILIYRLDPAAGTIVPNDPPFDTVPPGSGPRHFAFHPNGRTGYAINELTSTVTTFRHDPATGGLEALETVSTLPSDYKKTNSTAEVVVHPSGKFLYGSNRGHNSIAIFSIHEETGLLTPVGHQSTEGKTPRNFAVDPTGAYLLAANQESNTVVVFRIEPGTGQLTPTGHTAEVFTPVCLEFIPPPAP